MNKFYPINVIAKAFHIVHIYYFIRTINSTLIYPPQAIVCISLTYKQFVFWSPDGVHIILYAYIFYVSYVFIPMSIFL